MLSQRGKPLLVHDGHTFGIQYVRKDKKYWQCNLSRKYNCKARVTTTETGDIIVTNNEHCHTEIRQHLRKDYQRQKVVMNALLNFSTNRLAENLRRQQQQQQHSAQEHHQQQQSHHGLALQHHQQEQHHNLNNTLNSLQQVLVGGNPNSLSPFALSSHGAPNPVGSPTSVLDLVGKLSRYQQKASPDDHLDIADEPLDCGIRSKALNKTDDPSKVSESNEEELAANRETEEKHEKSSDARSQDDAKANEKDADWKASQEKDKS